MMSQIVSVSSIGTYMYVWEKKRTDDDDDDNGDNDDDDNVMKIIMT